MPSIQSLSPEGGSCFGIEAGCHAGIGNNEEIRAESDGAGNIRAILIRLPDDVGFCYVASAIGADDLHIAVGEAAGHKEVFAVIYERSDVLLGRAIDYPVLFSVVGIVACDTQASGKYHLVSPVDVADDGCAVTSSIVGAGSFPESFAGIAVQGNDIGGAVVVSVDDDFVLPENG